MRTERVDVCVIGSGAGGAVIAWEAAQRGLKTLVLERGPYLRAKDMSSSEIEMIPRLYKDGGMQLTTTLDMFILQGSCVGGSTVVSNMVLMRPSEDVFARWARRAAPLDVEGMRNSFEHIERTLEARHPPASSVSPSSELFIRGARGLGLNPKPMLKALGACKACGNCNIGCTFDTKQSSLSTFIRWSEARGARVLADTNVERIEIKRGKVECVHAKSGPRREPLRIYAKKVVVSAGAIGSSALLLASGVKKNVGTRLSFNAGAMVVAEFDQELDSYDADQMTTFVQHDGFLIEATHNPLMSGALTTPGWLREHAALMRRSRHLSYAGVMVPTDPTGRVVMSRWFGHEETRYRATPYEMRRLREGMKAIGRIFLRAGARRVMFPAERPTSATSEAEFSVLDERVHTLKDMQCGSSHPQGGNPMSDDPELGVVDTKLGVHGVDGLFVCDASIFPDCIAVNPMNTVMAMAHYAAPRMLAEA